MVQVKICGITRVQDAIAAAEAGANAIGLVFAKSPRRVSVTRAREIVAALPPFVAAIGVFVNEKPGKIRRITEQVGLTAVQLHGDESPRMVVGLRPLRVIKAVRIRDAKFMAEVRAFGKAGVGAIILDTHSESAFGGTGKTFDWKMVRGILDKNSRKALPPLILAGGLTVENVRVGIDIVRPLGVDVSGGVETRPGIKSGSKVRKFIAAARKQ